MGGEYWIPGILYWITEPTWRGQVWNKTGKAVTPAPALPTWYSKAPGSPALRTPATIITHTCISSSPASAIIGLTWTQSPMSLPPLYLSVPQFRSTRLCFTRFSCLFWSSILSVTGPMPQVGLTILVSPSEHWCLNLHALHQSHSSQNDSTNSSSACLSVCVLYPQVSIRHINRLCFDIHGEK